MELQCNQTTGITAAQEEMFRREERETRDESIRDESRRWRKKGSTVDAEAVGETFCGATEATVLCRYSQGSAVKELSPPLVLLF